MAIQDQFDHMLVTQGGHPAEDALLVPNIVRWQPGTGGSNQGYVVELDSGDEAYFKPRNGINRRIASDYGHDASQAVLHEAIAWRIAREFGPPFDTLVAPCVLRSIDLIDPAAPGALSAIHGEPLRPGFGTWQDIFKFDQAGCASAAFFDSLIGQQDRNPGNVRFDYTASSCRLIDHGYAFARHGDPINVSPLVGCRAQMADVRLDQSEIDALQMLLSSGDLCACRDGLDPVRAAALERRANSMLLPTILPEGGF